MSTRNWPPFLIFISSVAFGIAPLISVLIAGTLASYHGCALHEGNSNPCIILGADLGRLLYTMGMMGWFMFLTIPVALYGISTSVVMVIVAFFTRRRKKRECTNSTTDPESILKKM